MRDMSKGSSKEDKTILELIETSVPLIDKISARMGKKGYTNFKNAIDGFKRRLKCFYTDIANFDGKYVFIYLENVIGLVMQYHQLAVANYGEVVEGNVEYMTRLSTTLQGVIMSKLHDQMDIIDVKYSKVSSTSELEPLTKALEIFMTGVVWKPDPKAIGGFLYVSMVIFILDAFAFAELFLVKSMIYHSKQMSKSFEDNQDYWNQLRAYCLGVKPFPEPIVPFKFLENKTSDTPSDTVSDTPISDVALEVIKTSSVHLLTSEIVKSVQFIKPNAKKESIQRSLSRLVAKGLVGRTDFKSNNKYCYIPSSIQKTLRVEID